MPLCLDGRTLPAMSPFDAMDYEAFEVERAHFQLAIAGLEQQRAVLEARGDDVNAMLGELHQAWSQYETARQHTEAALEQHLQCLADEADAEEELLNHIRSGLQQWHDSLEDAGGLSSTERVRVWEAFQAWKHRVRDRVLRAPEFPSASQLTRVKAEVSALLGD